MVKVVASNNFGFDIFSFQFSNLFYGYSYNGNTTKYTVDYGSGTKDIFYGSGFSYVGAVPVTGTVSSYTGYYKGKVIATISEWNAKVTDIVAVAATTSTVDDYKLLAKLFSGADIFTGGSKNDIFASGGGNDTLKGNGGNDWLDGAAGNDKLDGGIGNDYLVGGLGKDILTGGSGYDSFIFTSSKDSTTTAHDVIMDFARGDKIDLSLIDANTKVSGNQSFSWIGSKAFTGHAGELNYKKISGDTFVYGDTNGDKKADFMIELENGYTPNSESFFL